MLPNFLDLPGEAVVGEDSGMRWEETELRREVYGDTSFVGDTPGPLTRRVYSLDWFKN